MGVRSSQKTRGLEGAGARDAQKPKKLEPGDSRLGLLVWRLCLMAAADPTTRVVHFGLASSFASLADLAPMPPGICAREGGLCHRERAMSSERDVHPNQRHGHIDRVARPWRQHDYSKEAQSVGSRPDGPDR